MGVAGSGADSWGVPDSLLGAVEEDFYAVVGRVTMLAALLDDVLLRLLWSLTGEDQADHAGTFGWELEKLCRASLLGFDEPFAGEVSAVLDDVATVRKQRNRIVHSIWPSPTIEKAFGWSSARPQKKGTSATRSVETTRGDLEVLVADLVTQIRRVDQLQVKGYAERARL